jgi:acyl-CoA reductase-like NAD-dependent aldehyde dehydrogenase
MGIMTTFQKQRILLGSGLVALLALAQGCGGDPNATMGPPISQEQQNAERAAREKAYGHGMPFGRGGKLVKPHVRSS